MAPNWGVSALPLDFPNYRTVTLVHLPVAHNRSLFSHVVASSWAKMGVLVWEVRRSKVGTAERLNLASER